MADIEDVRRLATTDNLAVVALARADGSVHASVVSAGVTTDPIDGSPAIGLVAMGASVKLRLLRESGQATVVFRNGGDWASVSGPARLIGPDDGEEYGRDVPEVIRDVYRDAGGEHEDWDEFDRVMAADRRCAVFVRADRITSNPTP